MMTEEKTLYEIAKEIRAKCPPDTMFFEQVQIYVQTRIKYEDRKGTWEVRAPELTWKLKTGDCSEMSLLIVEMLKSQGFPAEYIWGTYDGDVLHARVQVILKGKTYFIDALDGRLKNNFNRMGRGLHPQERIVYQ